MKIQVLISTMQNENTIDLIKKMNINVDAVVVNQFNKNGIKTYDLYGKKIKECLSNDKGLSKSRNLAIENSNADICVIADDDFIYEDTAFNNILKSYDKIDDADIILFSFTSNRKKVFPNKIKKINLISSMKACSAQITFKRKSIEDIKFDERFGSGSKIFLSGEENIFLADCLKKGLKIYYVPVNILRLEDKRKSTWFKGFDKEYFITKGACFYRINKKLSLILILQFAIRKYKLYKNNFNAFAAIKFMLDGKKKIQEMENR